MSVPHRWFELWRFDGEVGRRRFVTVGVLAFMLKHNLDRLVAWRFFGVDTTPFSRPVSPLLYLVPEVWAWDADHPKSLALPAVLLTLAIPFVWLGVAMTVKRLRSAGLSPFWVVLFFAPVVNLLFFAALSVLPQRASVEAAGSSWASYLNRFLPRSRGGSAALACVASLAVGVPALVLGVDILERYGNALFIGLPFVLGLLSAVIFNYRARRRAGETLLVACLAIALLGLLLVGIAAEGVLCVVMAAPIALALACLGALVGLCIASGWRGRAEVLPTLGVLVVMVPLLMGAEARWPAAAPLYEVRSGVDIEAAPDAVWENVVEFSDLPPPEEWLFRLGIAYPTRARIIGQGPRAVRQCVFSTGAFIEPIEVWDAPRRLAFSVSAQPAPMFEMSPYEHVHAPHLEGFLVSERGEFRLVPLPGGRTRLEGSTWYRHNMWPASYWRLWSDAIIHRIHLRVLEHIRTQSEGDARRGLRP